MTRQSCAATRRRCDGLSIPDVIDHYEQIIRGLDRPPIIIGHSFGGLFAQLLLDRGLGSAGVALSTAAPKGVLKLPLSTLRAAWPALKNPFGKNNVAPLTHEQFHWCFTNALSEETRRRSTSATTSPARLGRSSRPATRTSTRTPRRRWTTRTRRGRRSCSSPGAEDRICPPSVNEATFKKQRQAPAATEHKEYPGRCHYPGQDGWEEVADFILAWTVEHSNQPRGALA